MPQIGPAVSPTQKRQRANKRRLANPPWGPTFCQSRWGTGSGPPLGIWLDCGKQRATRDAFIDTAIFYLYFEDNYMIIINRAEVASSVNNCLVFGEVKTLVSASLALLI
jgi:hypothetical protein